MQNEPDKKIKSAINPELAGIVVAAIRKHVIYLKSKAMMLPEQNNDQFTVAMKNIQELHEYANELEEKIIV